MQTGSVYILDLCFSPADFNADGIVDAADLSPLIAAWGEGPGHPADLTADDVVNAYDLALLLGAWGTCQP